MKACPRNLTAYLRFVAGLLLLAAGSSPAQQPAHAPSSPPIGAQAQSSVPADPAAQIDQLLKKANDAIYLKGQLKEAEELSKQALELSKKLGDTSRTMRANISLGTSYAYQYRWLEGFELIQQATQQARELGDKKALVGCLNSSGTVMRALGRSEEALSYYNQTITLAREVGDLPVQWSVLRNIGALYYETGESDKAEPPLRESLRVARELKDKAREAISLYTLGLREMYREHYSAALNYYEQSLALKPENPLVLTELLNNIGITHESLGDSKRAVEVLQQALKTQEDAGNGTNPIVLSNLGDSLQSLGQLPEALSAQKRALTLARKAAGGMTWREWAYERRIGKVQRAMGKSEEALMHYQTSLDELEHLRPGVLATESGRATVQVGSHGAFVETADLLVDLHREAEALETAERGHARAFLDLVAESRVGIAEELTPEQLKREDALLARISAVQKELWKEGIAPDEEKKRKAELTGAENELEAFHTEMRQTNPRYASIQYPEPIRVAHIQNELLDGHTALVEFLLGENRSLVWVVSKDKVSVGILPPRKQIEEQVAAYRKALPETASTLTLHQSLAEIHRDATKLYSALLQPVENAIGSYRTLVIVPDGALNYLPFETLVAGSARGIHGETQPSYLTEKFAFVYGPSASALVTIRAMNHGTAAPRKTLLAFGDPLRQTDSALTKNSSAPAATRSSELAPAATGEKAPAAATDLAASSEAVSEAYAERGFSFARLPYTRDEVLAISSLYPPSQRRIYLGNQAREETVKSEKLDQYRYIHFASHGFIDETKPGRSGLLLSRDPQSAEDGILQMGEVMRLKLNADLVTLSACSTGLGKLVSGEGILGLTRAFFYSGARNVTVSLWNVNDSATATLMKSFYGNMNRGLSKAAALRQAKLSLLRGENELWRHPYFWAAFVLVGEGK